MTLDELIAALVLLRQTPEDGATDIHLWPDAFTAKGYIIEIERIEREADPKRFMIVWGDQL